MSAEIAVTMALAVRKGGTVDGIDLGRFSVTMTGGNILHNRQAVGASEEALVLGDCGAGGWVIMVNRDAVNLVSVRAASGASSLVTLLAGEGAIFRLNAGATAPFVISAGAGAELEYLLLEA